MKTFYIKYFVGVLLLAMLGLNTYGQGSRMPQNLVGTDLNRAEATLRKDVEKGQQSQIIHLAEVLFFNGQFEEALKYYQRADSLNLVRTPQQRRNFTHVARMFDVSSPYGDVTDYFFRDWQFETTADAFCGNSPNEDFAPYLWNELLFVTSSRDATRRVYDFTNKPFLDVFVFEDDCKAVYIPRFLPNNLNTRWHDGPLAISADTNLVIITRNYSQPNQSGFRNLYLEYFVRENGRWSNGIRFPFATPAVSVQHPFYNDAEATLYFASNTPGGQGGFDLYKSKWNGQRWELPVNLGTEINSSYDEVFPSFSPDGYLIYATNHIETMGGLDLVIYREGVRVLFPEPINSRFDDFSLIFKNENEGYFASNRTDGAFGDNIYSFKIKTREPLPVERNYFARVIEKDTGKPIEGGLVAFSSFDKGISGSFLTNSNGEVFIFKQFPGIPAIHFDVSKPGFRTIEITTDQFALTGDRMVKTFEMERATEPEVVKGIDPAAVSGTIVLYFENDIPRIAPGGLTATARYNETLEIFLRGRNQYFTNSASSRQELEAFFNDLENGMKELEAFARFLEVQLKSGVRIMIDLAAFASPLASSEYNALLSERRNFSVINFFNAWQGGVLKQYMDNGALHFLERAYGDTQAPPNISDSPVDREQSVYGVRASRERRVVLFWKRQDAASVSINQNNDLISKYHYIIIGSFRNKQGAEKALEELIKKGAVSPGIIPDKDGVNFRVYFGRYQRIESALNDLPEVRRKINQEAWVATF